MLGALLLASLAVELVRRTRRDAEDDPVLDPRTGIDLRPPLPRWTAALLLALPVGLALVVALVVAQVA